MVDTFMAQAAEKLGPARSKVFVALFCTHFGYCRDLIKEKLQSRIRAPVTVLDPNQRMAAYLFEASGGQPACPYHSWTCGWYRESSGIRRKSMPFQALSKNNQLKQLRP